MTIARPESSSRSRFRSRLPIRILNRIAAPAVGAGLWPQLTVPAVKSAVRRAGGDLERLDPLIVEGMEVRVRAYSEEARLSPFGVTAIRRQLIHCLKNAVEIQRAIEAEPRILDERIERPLFILGMPRTGTTILQRLLSQHAGARHLAFWEGYRTAPADIRNPQADQAARVREGEQALATLYWLAPGLRAIHPMGARDPEECFYLFRNSFLIPSGYDVAYLPSYWAWIDAADRSTAAYRHFKRLLQLLQWLQRKKHWVLKCPLHFAAVPALLEVFPDARIVLTHRDPAECIASLCSLTRVMWGISSEHADDRKVGRYVIDTAERLAASAGPALARLGPDQRFDAAFAGLMADPPAMTAAIYDQLGYEPDPGLLQRAAAWLASNPREKHGRHTYTLEDFDLSADEVHRRLRA